MKAFKCGLCREEKRVSMTRKGFRKHLAEEHRILNNKFNAGYKNVLGTKTKGKKQTWVIEVKT